MSNVIKVAHYVTLHERKLIGDPLRRPFSPAGPDEEEDAAKRETKKDEQLAEAIAIKEQIIRDAEAYAASLIGETERQVNLMKAEAKAEIESWWQERRAEDEIRSEEARKTGFEEGYRQGFLKAEADVKEQYARMLAEAGAIIEQAVAVKQRTILEAEPFLIDLSCAIAEKVIGRQLSLEPQWVIDLIRDVLRRRRERGVITLCVAPEQVAFIQEARDELMLVIDSQAELQIIPDPTVRDHGCVIRSSYGSIDARIDTQLNEIKNSLRQIAAQQSEGAAEHV